MDGVTTKSSVTGSRPRAGPGPGPAQIVAAMGGMVVSATTAAAGFNDVLPGASGRLRCCPRKAPVRTGPAAQGATSCDQYPHRRR